MKNIIRWATTLGAAAVLGGLMTSMPVQAQGYQVRHDIIDVRRDQRRLDDLYSQRRRAAARRDWRNVQRIDRDIAQLRRHIDRDRRDLRGDVRWDRDDRSRRDYDRDRYRDR